MILVLLQVAVVLIVTGGKLIRCGILENLNILYIIFGILGTIIIISLAIFLGYRVVINFNTGTSQNSSFNLNIELQPPFSGDLHDSSASELPIVQTIVNENFKA